VTVDVTGQWLYVDYGLSGMSAFAIDAVSGLLTAAGVFGDVPGGGGGPVPPAFGFSPATLAFVAQEGGSSPAAQLLYVSNVGGGVLSWTASADATWLTLSPTSGTGTAPVTVTAALGALTAGTYNALITLSAPEAATVTVPVTFTVGPPAPSATVPRFVYATNQNENTLSTYAVDAASGQLRPTGYVLGGGYLTSVVVEPSGRFAYVANQGSSVLAYGINSATGSLTAVPGSPFATGTNPLAVRVDPSGQRVYVASYGSNRVWAYTITESSGALTPLASAASVVARSGPSSIAFVSGTAPLQFTSKFAYTANQGGNNVAGYTVDGVTGALTAVAGSPFTAGTSPRSVTVEPSGRFAYVANAGSNNVSAYTVNGTSGTLTAVSGSPYAAGTAPRHVTVDPTGRFVYVANEGANTVSAYTLNTATGALSAISGSPFAAGTSPRSVTVEPSGRFAYVANAGANTVSAYTVNRVAGTLTAMAGSPFLTGGTPRNVTVDPTGRFAYVANETSNDVSMFTISSTTGALTAVGTPVAAGINPVSVAVDPTGRFAYVASQGGNTVSAFAINQTTGELTAMGVPLATGTLPASVTVDVTGRWLYVANLGSNDVSIYSIDSLTGALTASGTVVGPPPMNGPFSLIVSGLSQ
jgi:6-phosphogluconolactonase (cycloisomerase 2 family)